MIYAFKALILFSFFKNVTCLINGVLIQNMFISKGHFLFDIEYDNIDNNNALYKNHVPQNLVLFEVIPRRKHGSTASP